MNQSKRRLELVFPVIIATVAVTGCTSGISWPRRPCLGAVSTQDSLAWLRLRLAEVVPVKANGQCVLQYSTNGKLHRESFPTRLWVSPPTHMYLQGDLAFDPRGLEVGANKNEFWIAIRPKEISTYWWGTWGDASCFKNLAVSPGLILEALGVVVVGDDGDHWQLSQEADFDVLTRYNKLGEKIQKMYFERCYYLVKRIEYFDTNQEVSAVTELSEYKKATRSFRVPTSIRIMVHSKDCQEGITFDLKSIGPADFSDEQRTLLFARPQPRGFKHIYRITEDCELIEQPQQKPKAK